MFCQVFACAVLKVNAEIGLSDGWAVSSGLPMAVLGGGWGRPCLCPVKSFLYRFLTSFAIRVETRK